MHTEIFLIIGVSVVTAYLLILWVSDLRAEMQGRPHRRPLPGAVPCPAPAVWLGVAGALVLVGLETGGEYLLDWQSVQEEITFLFLAAMIAAAFTEELVFRGFLVVQGSGRAALVGSVIGFSVLYALLHPLLWEWADSGIVLKFGGKAAFSTGFVFLKSLWFYALRFLPVNPKRSLLPCIAAHLASNASVFLIKALQGHVNGWY